MYPVTELFKTKIKETTRIFKTSVQIQHSAGTLVLTDEDIVGGSIIFTESSQTGQDFTIGGAVASSLEFSIVNKTDSIHGFFLVDTILTVVDDLLKPIDYYEEYTGINFEGATVIPQIALLVSENPDVWEYVPLGRFNVDEVNKTRNAIRLKAIDNMIELDKPYSLSSLGYPATLYQIYANICTVADVQPATTSFANQDYLVQNRPEGDYTLRDILSYVAQLSGSFARFNRTGALGLNWYTPTGLTLTGANRFNFVAREDLVQIKGVKFETDDIIYLAGTDEYVVDLSENPLLQNDYATVISNIYNKVKDTVFTPFESKWQGNPAIQAGDVITQIDRDGKSYSTIVTHSTYKYRGASTLAARGMPIKAKRYTGSTNKKIAEIKRKIEKDVGDKLTSLEQAQLNVTELIANMLGGYVVKTDDAIYIADNPNIDIAMKVWKWGLGGFGYSSTGKDGPYTTGISADGTIVAMLVAANIITADMVQTGILQSEDGSSWLNLDDGSFNFKEVLKYVDGKLQINAPDIIRSSTPYKGVTIGLEQGIYVEFNDGGHAQIGDGSILVQHIDGSHTRIDGRGIMRQFSVPIFEQAPTEIDVIETFETGNLSTTRVDYESSYVFQQGSPIIGEKANYIKLTTEDKYTGLYSLKITCPTAYYLVDKGSSVRCYFINYRPTKNTTLALKYKTALVNYTAASLLVEDMDYPGTPGQVIPLTSSTWSTANASLTMNHTYRISIYICTTNSDVRISNSAVVYIDNVEFELDVNSPIIVGYEQSLQPYYDFTYTRKASFASGVSQIQVTLPDYFRGLNFDVIVHAPARWDFHYMTGDEPPSLKILSINNLVPSFTVQCDRYPVNNVVDFPYTVILNS